MNIRQIVREELRRIVMEQENADKTSPFSDAEQAFLGKFAVSNSRHLGIIYNKSEVGLEEFLHRSGFALNLNADILHSLLKSGVISIIPYGGLGRNEDYTIQLNLDIEDVEQYRDKAEAGAEASAGGGDVDTGEAVPEETPEETPEPPAPNEWVTNYGDILLEIAKIIKTPTQQKKSLSERTNADVARVLQRLPKGYLTHLDNIIRVLGRKVHNKLEKEHLVADILDTLSHNFGLTPDQIYRSYIYYKSQNRLQRILGK